MRGRCCCVVCTAVLARISAWSVNSLWGRPRKVRAYTLDVSLIERTVTLTILYKFRGGSMIAVCTLHLLNTYLCL